MNDQSFYTGEDIATFNRGHRDHVRGKEALCYRATSGKIIWRGVGDAPEGWNPEAYCDGWDAAAREN